jgi:type IV pilus assembly protein PilW
MPHRQRGMTLIELMVALAIGLGVVLAITSLLITGENHKRVTTSTNDAEQTGAYVFYALDRALRSAGSAFVESAYPTDRGVLGCRLNVASILPRTSAFPAPFATAFLAGATNTLRVAPLLIARRQSDDGKSDVLVSMGGSGAGGGVSRQVTGTGGANTLVLDSTVAFNNNDMALVSQSGTTDCLLEQVGAINGSALTVSGTQYYTAGATTSLATLASSTSSYVSPIGNAAANNVQFQLFGVSANRTLYSYDLLQNLRLMQGVGGDVAQAIADGVDQMNAIYGIDTNGDGIQDTWAGPGDAGYDINTVMTTAATMRKIVSVRVALVLRGQYYEKNIVAGALTPVSPPTLTVFSGLTNLGGTSLQQTINLSATDQQYRYRVFEFTIPLRNMLLLAGATGP